MFRKMNKETMAAERPCGNRNKKKEWNSKKLLILIRRVCSKNQKALQFSVRCVMGCSDERTIIYEMGFGNLFYYLIRLSNNLK